MCAVVGLMYTCDCVCVSDEYTYGEMNEGGGRENFADRTEMEEEEEELEEEEGPGGDESFDGEERGRGVDEGSSDIDVDVDVDGGGGGGSSSDEEQDGEKEGGENVVSKGVLEGGKVENFSRAFSKLVDHAQEASTAAPILAVRSVYIYKYTRLVPIYAHCVCVDGWLCV